MSPRPARCPEGLRALGTVDVVSRDGLSAFGAVTRHMIRDGYRWQLRWAPWTYAAMYWLVTRVAPVRGAGALALAVAGQRRLRRLVRREQPDVVVTTHPALTCVARSDAAAAQARDPAVRGDHRPRRLSPVVAPRRRPAPGDARARRRARRAFAGAGSAALVRPLVRGALPGDRRPRDGAAAASASRRRAPVAVSGGGWGVGDLAGAVDAALGCDDTDVVVLAGRNETRRASLEERYGATQRVHVWGFTERMDDAAARRRRGRAFDGRRDLAGGAELRLPADRLRQLDRPHPGAQPDAWPALGSSRSPTTRPSSRPRYAAISSTRPARSAPLPAAGADAAAALIGIRPRVRPLPRWRTASGTFATCLAAAAALLVGLSTDDAYSLAARPLELRPITHVAAAQPDVGLVAARAPGLQSRGSPAPWRDAGCTPRSPCRRR